MATPNQTEKKLRIPGLISHDAVRNKLISLDAGQGKYLDKTVAREHGTK